jgi:hypothetical protein
MPYRSFDVNCCTAQCCTAQTLGDNVPLSHGLQPARPANPPFRTPKSEFFFPTFYPEPVEGPPPTSDFRPPTSDFRLPTSDLWPLSFAVVCPPTSDLWSFPQSPSLPVSPSPSSDLCPSPRYFFFFPLKRSAPQAQRSSNEVLLKRSAP